MDREIHLTRGKVALVSAEDYERVNRHKWYAYKSSRTWYAARTLPRPEKGTLYMHRFILGSSAARQVDHIDGNGLNNTRPNLRLVTQTENKHNSRRPVTNTSGYKGVSRRRKRWQVSLSIDGKTKHVGTFDDVEEAARAYDQAARRHYGKFAQTNFPREEPTP